MIPTIKQVMKCYRVIAQSERMKTGRPGVETVANALRGARGVCRAAGIDLDQPINSLTRKAIDSALATFTQSGIARVSAWSYVNQLRSVFARWCIPYYKDAGWEIPALDLPVFRVQTARYIRPSAEMMERIKNWYLRLEGEMWFAATMMMEYAMRNGDVLRLRDENFVTTHEDGTVVHYLSYTPHKTALSSGRRVYWPIHNTIWERFDDYGGLRGIDVTEETFQAMNRDLRSIGFVGSKASYELRKICIDHIYQRFGAELATSISGDDIKTITHFYADPSQPNVRDVRVLDLL